ncbi:hypothetical protein T484DRAFT_1753746 [Baffinella frigidus]|nr:hypothetical protein T484DRAFT_1753746 [Cryptophyta sp. CCMP2293]
MARLPLFAAAALVLLPAFIAAQCFDVLGQRGGGHASLALTQHGEGGVCTRLISPKWHYGEEEEPGLAGAGLGIVMTAEGRPVCAGAVVEKGVVLTAAGCADGAWAVEVAGNTFAVSEVRRR